jgi:tRNA threonylcarbamoyladenosine biosynthesis protein TsaE
MVKSFEIFSQSPSQTKKVGQILASQILRGKLKRAFVLGLIGDLGGGKTTFLQGFAKGLKIKEKILSPTFIILKKFKVKSSKFKVFYHIDCYRIKRAKEILNLGFKEIISNPKNIVAIEWAEKIKKILPKGALILKFDFLDQKKRKISLWRKSA